MPLPSLPKTDYHLDPMIVPARGAERGVLLSWPRPYPENPYLPRLAAALAETGVTTRSARYLATLAARPDHARWLHVHWPEWMLTDASRARAHARAAWFDALVRVARARGLRLAWTAHNLLGHDDPHSDLARAARVRWLAACDVVFGHFPSAEQDVRDLGFRGRFALTPHPHFADDYPAAPARDVARRALGYAPGETVVLAFGAIEPYKGFDRLAAAFVRHAPATARLLVAGRASDRGAVEALHRAVGGDPRVRVETAFVPRERVPMLFAAADVLACAYRSFYTSGTAMLALSFGTPLLGPAVHHLAAFAGEPFFVECPEPEALAAAWPRIERLDPSTREVARACALRHTWSDVARTMVHTMFDDPAVRA